MKVSRKIDHDRHSVMAMPKSEEIAPSLRLIDLPKEVEGLEPGKDFEAHIKGKCVGYECRRPHGEKEGEAKHHYELELHHFDHKDGEGKAPKQKKSTREQTDEAMKKYDKEEEEKKSKKESEKGDKEKKEY